MPIIYNNMKTIFLIIFLASVMQVKAQQAKLGPTGVPFGNVMPGPNSVSGVLMGQIENSYNAYLPAIKQYDIYKDARGNGNFKKIITVTFPGSYADFAQRVGEATATEVKNLLNAKTNDEAYQLLRIGDPKKIGFAFLSKSFLSGIGMAWEDKEIKDNTAETVYRVMKIYNDGKEEVLFTQKTADIARIPMPKYQLQNLSTTDSLVQASWMSKTLNSPVYYAKVYRKASNEQKYQQINTSFVFSSGDTSKTSFSERVNPGNLFNYFIIPEDFAGNQGLPSDTAFAISKSFSSVKGITDFKAKDSLKGAWLSWRALPNEGVYTGIQILKSRKNNNAFIEVATIAPTDSVYYDKAVLPNVIYYYQIRPLTIQPKGWKLLPSATTNVAIKNKGDIPLAPQGLKVYQDSTAQVKLIWELNPEIDQFAYYVLRGTNKNNMQIVSPALRSNRYTDSLKNLDGESTYLYAVKLMNLSQKMSNESNIAMIKPLKLVFVQYPSGISARFAESVVKLQWENMIEKYDDVVGYRIYRKAKGDKTFTLLNKQALNLPFYNDTTARPGADYEYGVTSVNGSDVQSVLSPLAQLTVPTSASFAPPADLYLTNKAEGVFISWPQGDDNTVINVIYRKALTDVGFKKVTEVNQHAFYTDSTAQKGILYTYHIVAKTKSGESKPGIEKSIRRN